MRHDGQLSEGVVGLEGVVAMVVVVVGEGQFFLHPVGFPRRRFTLLSIDTDGVNNARGVLLLIDDGDGTAPRILFIVSSSLMLLTSIAAVDGSNENSKKLVGSWLFLFV